MDEGILYILVSNIALLLLFAGAFLPRGRKDCLKGFWRFRFYIVIIIMVVLLHLVEVNLIDDKVTMVLGKDFAPLFYSYERLFFDYLLGLRVEPLIVVSVFFYMILYTFTLWFTPMLFILSEEEDAMRSLSYGLLAIYLFALPFYLFMPVTNVYTFLGMESSLDRILPGIERFFYSVTTKNNCFPSLHVAVSLLLFRSSRYMRERRYSYVLLLSAFGVVFSVIYLSIHWLTDVAGGVILFALSSILVDRVNSIERKVLRRITPSLAERRRLKEVVAEVMGRIENSIREKGIDVTPKLVGSVAKDTYLRGSIDIDIFLLFPPSTPRKEMERKGLEIGKEVLEDWEERYAEHPYVKGKFKGYEIEIVPCYRVERATERITAVDRTPFHTDFIRRNLSARKRKEVRLLKQFLKGIGCYGAEAEVEGFSGYLCELLILKYGSFREVLKNAKDWKKGEVIKLHDVPSRTFRDPLIFIDPVDPNRNVASAVSEEKLEIFKRACREYLLRPSERFFFPRELKPLPDEKIREKITGFVGIEIEKPDIIPDNLYPQARKTLRRIIRSCEENGFKIDDGGFVVTEDKVYMIMKPKMMELDETYIHRGPPEKEEMHVRAFLEKWKGSKDVVRGPYLKDGRWYVEVKRRYRRIEDFLRKNIERLSLGKDIEKMVKEGRYKILSSKDLLRDDLKLFWTDYIERKMPWER